MSNLISKKKLRDSYIELYNIMNTNSPLRPEDIIKHVRVQMKEVISQDRLMLERTVTKVPEQKSNQLKID
jgi:hypothetical protein